MKNKTVSFLFYFPNHRERIKCYIIAIRICFLSRMMTFAIQKRKQKIWQVTTCKIGDLAQVPMTSETYDFFSLSLFHIPLKFPQKLSNNWYKERKKVTLHRQLFTLLTLQDDFVIYNGHARNVFHNSLRAHVSISFLTFNRPTNSINSCSFFVSCIVVNYNIKLLLSSFAYTLSYTLTVTLLSRMYHRMKKK